MVAARKVGLAEDRALFRLLINMMRPNTALLLRGLIQVSMILRDLYELRGFLDHDSFL